MTNILVTGANGFVGKALVTSLIEGDVKITACVRHNNTPLYKGVKQVIQTVDSKTDWKKDLVDIDVVIHLAARVHVMNDTELNSLLAFREINTAGTLNLARQASLAGVKRFIFISSIKVNGESTDTTLKFKADDKVSPSDPYAISKFKAELGLLALAEKCTMDVVIIRPPLVYGPGVKANFAVMMRWVYKRIPLPLGAIHNQRSLVALDNLVNFIIHCIDHPKAANEIFLISDGEDVSTTQLIQKIAKSLQKKIWLVSVPAKLIRYFAKLVGKGDEIDRLLGSLQIDNSKAKQLLSWSPVITMNEQLKKMAMEYDK
jgi:nucleoside-diphosphate-sugar epimerase